jgi:hypothetical protein
MAKSNQKGPSSQPEPNGISVAIKAAEKQLLEQQRILEYDTKEFTIEVLVAKFGDGGDDADIYIPQYQREFGWDERRQSRFVESLLLGLPIPFLFFADMTDGRLEVVDGSQRLRTCRAFLAGKLELIDSERLDKLDGFRFDNLPKAQQRRLLNRTIRAVVLSQNAKESDRRDLFDRINTGSLVAKPAEVRRGSSPGPVTDLIEQLAQDSLFKKLCPVSEASARKRTRDELVTRFFAFSDNFDQELPGYQDRVGDYLDAWLVAANARAKKNKDVVKVLRERFNNVMKFVDQRFPHGFTRKEGAQFTPMVRFDAIAVGTAEALKKKPGLIPRVAPKNWLVSNDFLALTTSNAANVRSSILNRIEFVRNRLLA